MGTAYPWRRANAPRAPQSPFLRKRATALRWSEARGSGEWVLGGSSSFPASGSSQDTTRPRSTVKTSLSHFAVAGFLEAVLVFLLYNTVVAHLIGGVIMDWKEPGKLAACGDDCESKYGWH